MKNFWQALIIILVIFILIFIGQIVLEVTIEEKYCYNLGFVQLEKRGIVFGRFLGTFNNDSSDIYNLSGGSEWHDFYVECRRSFNVFNIDPAILLKKYPYYKHFIDW